MRSSRLITSREVQPVNKAYLMNSTALGIGTVGHPPLGRRPATWQTSRVLYSTRAEARLVDLSLPCGLSFALRCLTRRYSTALQHRLYVTPVHEISTMVLLFCGYFRCFCLTLPKCSAWSQDRLEYLLSGRIPMYCVLEKHLCNSMSTFTSVSYTHLTLPTKA